MYVARKVQIHRNNSLTLLSFGLTALKDKGP